MSSLIFYYRLRHSLTEIQPCRNVHVQDIQVCLTVSVKRLHPDVPFVLLSLFTNLLCKITENPTLLPVNFKTHEADT